LLTRTVLMIKPFISNTQVSTRILLSIKSVIENIWVWNGSVLSVKYSRLNGTYIAKLMIICLLIKTICSIPS
jgi:hypothetical protein